jgi:hypothetical protein
MQARQRYKHLVSIGRHCRPAHQIRRYTETAQASYFDWVVTSHDAILYSLRHGLHSLFHRDNLAITDDGLGVVDVQSGIFYYHHFSRSSPAGKIDLQSIDREYYNQKKKFEFLASRWYNLISSQETLYVRQDDIVSEQVQELHSAMLNHIGHENFGLLLVIAPDHTLTVEHPRIHVVTGDSASRPGENWKGDDDCWSFILNQYWQRADMLVPERLDGDHQIRR